MPTLRLVFCYNICLLGNDQIFPFSCNHGQISGIRLFFYRMVKRVRRLIRGDCEIARICGGDPSTQNEQLHSTDMTKSFWREWSTSKQLREIFHASAKDAHMSTTDLTKQICQTKKVVDDQTMYALDAFFLLGQTPCSFSALTADRTLLRTSSAPTAHRSENVEKCLSDIKGVNTLIAHVETLSATKFDTDNSEHEIKLQTLWETLLPGVERKDGRYSREWGHIGFQQSDPKSDFRGGGILALDQLLYIASTRASVAKRMISEPEAEVSRYPWACVGINLTVEAIRILKARRIDGNLYAKKNIEDRMAVFNELYADMFEILHDRWVKAKPENLLAFPKVLKDALKDIDEEVITKGSLVPPGTSA